jgi:hypothetical protein
MNALQNGLWNRIFIERQESRTVQVGIGVGQGGAGREVTYRMSSADIPQMKSAVTEGVRVLCEFSQSGKSMK